MIDASRPLSLWRESGADKVVPASLVFCTGGAAPRHRQRHCGVSDSETESSRVAAGRWCGAASGVAKRAAMAGGAGGGIFLALP